MDAAKWTDIATVLVAMVALGLTPWVGWKLARKGQQEDARRQVRLNVFAGVMENRHSTESIEAIRALNLIDIAFHDSPEVRRLWREYFEMINSRVFFQDGLGGQLRDQKLQELLTEMARSLDFGVDRFDVARIYAPKWLTDEETARFWERQARLEAVERARAGVGGPAQPASPTAAMLPTSPAQSGLRPGIYLVRYTGAANATGVGTLAMGNGQISGSDIVGGRYAGSYSVVGDRIRGTVILHVPAGTTLVTGTIVDANMDIPIALDLPLAFADGQFHRVDVAGQSVGISFQRIQDL